MRKPKHIKHGTSNVINGWSVHEHHNNGHNEPCKTSSNQIQTRRNRRIKRVCVCYQWRQECSRRLVDWLWAAGCIPKLVVPPLDLDNLQYCKSWTCVHNCKKEKISQWISVSFFVDLLLLTHADRQKRQWSKQCSDERQCFCQLEDMSQWKFLE